MLANSTDVDPVSLKTLSSVLVILALITTAGNIMIIVLLFRTPSLRKPAFILTANITIADLIFLLFSLPQYAAALILNSTVSPFGTVLCYVQVYASNSTVATTVYFMAAIAVFRTINVCYPVKCLKLCTRKWTVIFCLVFWSFPLLVCATFDKGVKYDTEKFVCVFVSPGYLYGLVILVYVPAFIVMPVAYGKVLWFVRQSRRRIEAHSSLTSGTVNMQKDRHVFKLVIAIMIIFLISISIPNIVYTLSHSCLSCDKYATELVGAWLVRLRPPCNFVTIMITCSFLRNAFRTRMHGCCKT